MMLLLRKGTKARRDQRTKGDVPVSAARAGARRGYSFPEVMFAVVVLGIGFIMLAAIFPVALQQSKLTLDETRASAIARQAVNYLQQLAYDPTPLPADGPPWLDPRTMAGAYANRAVFPATGGVAGPVNLWPGDVHPIINPLRSPAGDIAWDSVRNNMIVKDDPRFAWVAFYRRDGNPR